MIWNNGRLKIPTWNCVNLTVLVEFRRQFDTMQKFCWWIIVAQFDERALNDDIEIRNIFSQIYALKWINLQWTKKQTWCHHILASDKGEASAPIHTIFIRDSDRVASANTRIPLIDLAGQMVKISQKANYTQRSNDRPDRSDVVSRKHKLNSDGSRAKFGFECNAISNTCCSQRCV